MRGKIITGIFLAVLALIFWHASHTGILPPLRDSLMQVAYIAAAAFALSVLVDYIRRFQGKASSIRFRLRVFLGAFLLGMILYLGFAYAMAALPEKTATPLRLALVRIFSQIISLLSKVF